MTEVVLAQASIPSAALDIVQERVDRVARRADRKGFPRPRLEAGEREVRTVYERPAWITDDMVPPTGIPRDLLIPKEVEYVDVTIVAEDALVIGGWQFIASVDPIEVDGAVTALYRRVPGTEAVALPARGRNPGECDHCRTDRIRNETFLLWHPDHGYKQVGRQCVRDFIGYDADAMLAAIAAYRDLEFDEDEIGGWGRAAPQMYPTDVVLTAAAQAVLQQGFYVSKAKAEQSEWEAEDPLMESKPLRSTGSVVRFLLTPPHNEDERRAHEQYESWPAEKVLALVDATKAGIAELRWKERGEWEDNVLLLSETDHVAWKHVGVLASAVILGSRQQERAARAKVAAEKAPSRHFGEKGKRYDFDATVELVRFFDNDWGGTFLLKFRGDDADFLWWSSSPQTVEVDGVEREYQTGDRVHVRATVKEHEIDRYTQQPVTVLSRAKLTPPKEQVALPVAVAAPAASRLDDALPF